MDAQRWDEVQTAFDELVELEVADRVDRLAEIGTTDPDLKRTLESLLAADVEAEERLASIEAALSPRVTAEHLDRVKAAISDRYRVERELGSGGMATVYLAEDLKHHRKVAVKVLRLAAPVGPQRFLREIETTARLDHPHLLPLLDSGETAGFLFYVMPYVEGESLRDRLERDEPLAIDDVVRIALEVADALEFAHQHDVIHRDIKPENILLGAGHARVADFGIARAISASAGDSPTDAGLGTGTPAYMSPEQAVGSAELDPRSDVYSLGCVVYEMLAGEPPFTGPTVEEVSRKHMTAQLPDLGAVRRGLPSQLVAAVSRALEKTPDDRFQSAREFAEALGSELSVSPLARRHAARQQRVLLGAAAAVVLAIAVAMGQWGLRGRGVPGPPEATYPRASIAVLPFENLATEPSRAYFASGLHNELLTQLAKASALKVISRTSVQEYAETTKPLAVIAEELGVGSIVEASVQVEGDRLRVNVQLIDTATDEHLWAESYNRTIDDVFATQSEIAGHIVSAVGASLTEEEAGAFVAAPTESPEAYRLYLQGQAYTARPGYHREDFESAQELYEQALALDSSFALARAALSGVHGSIWLFYDQSPERFARALEEAEIALRLAPDLLAAQMAMIGIHWFREEWQEALDKLVVALQRRPNDPRVISSIGGTHRRLGNWDEAVAAIEQAMALEPRSASLYWDLGAMTLRYLHRYADALNALNHALILDPDFVEAQLMRAEIHLEWRGELDSLRALIDRGPESFGLGGSRLWWQVRVALLERQPDVMLTFVGAPEALPVEAHGIEQLGADALGLLFEGWAHQLRRDETAARRAFATALVQLDSVLRERPRDWQVHASRGLALAGLGRPSEARREAEWLDRVENWPDVYARGQPRVQRAMILAQAGWVEEAIVAIEPQLAGPGWISTHVLRIDPRWDPIRDDPRFLALLARYEN